MRPDNWLGTTILVAAAFLMYGALKVRSELFLFLRLALYFLALTVLFLSPFLCEP